jgi:hypothetical protein
VASITNIYTNCNGQYGGKIAHINLINAGCGYTEAPWITIQGGGGVGAAATAGIATGTIQYITVTDGGSGYTTAPNVSFQTFSFDDTHESFDSNEYSFDNDGSFGSVARAYSAINTAGVVTAIYVSYGGYGYTNVPQIVIDGPTGIATGVGVGTYIFNEVITGQTSGVTARVKEWEPSTNSLEISIVDGTFTPGEVIVGSESGAKYSLSVQNTDDLVTPYADNDNIEIAADSIIDFSETNPFGMP